MMELWKQAEALIANFFGFKKVPGSGCGHHDKQDSYDEDWLCEVKSHQDNSYGINYLKFREWRRNAAKVGKNLMVSIVPIVDGKPSLEDSTTTVSTKLFKALLDNQKED